MLAHILALLVGLGSFGLYMAAFFFPEIHRRNDFIWSGVGLFYALVLWVCGGRITGGLLLGQIAGVALLGWLGWQTFLLRRQVAPIDQQTPLPTPNDLKATFTNLTTPEGRSQLSGQASRVLGQIQAGLQTAITSATQAKPQELSNANSGYIPPKLEEFGTAGQEAIERFAKAAIPDESLIDEAALTQSVDNLQDAVTEVTTAIDEQGSQLQSAISAAANEVAKSVPSVQQTTSPATSPTSKITNFVKVLTETIQSLFKGPAKKQNKAVYVRKQFREDGAHAATQITEATIISDVEKINQATEESLIIDAVIEIENQAVAADSLTDELANASAEEIVEELLEDISAQEQTSDLPAATDYPEAIPPNPPSPELIDAAVADAEAKGVSYDPPLSE
jgi:hypothetical protein